MFKLRSKKKIQEQLELDKSIRHIVYKIVQVIVQSRLGSKIRTYCKPICYANDYFGIAINDVPDVLTQSKILLESGPIINKLPLSIEISLKTVDGNSLVLENWKFGISSDEPSSNTRSSNNFYNEVNLLLRSLIAASRAMPAYKLSRNQEPKAYTIYYRLNMGEYDSSTLGPDYKVLKIGKIVCPRGILHIEVKYRTNMITSPEIESVKNIEPKPQIIDKPKTAVDLTKPLLLGAFVDLSKSKEFKDENFPEDPPPCSWLLEIAQGKSNFEHMKINKAEKDALEEEQRQEEAASAAFFLPKDREKAWRIEEENYNDKFAKPLNCAFTKDTPWTELASFYREFCDANPLESLAKLDLTKGSPTKECGSCGSIDISKQLEEFEAPLEDFDQMIADLCQFSNEYI